MYIKQAFKIENDWWLYLAGTVIVVVACMLGSIPHSIAVLAIGSENLDALDNPDDMYELLGLLDSNLNFFLMLISFAFGLLALFFVVKKVHKQSIISLTTSRKKIDWGRFWFSFIFWGSFTVILVMIEYFISPENFSFNFQLFPFLILFFIAVIFIPLQAGFEEFLFRGYLMQGLGVLSKNRWLPLLVTSILFGFLHGANPEVQKLGSILLIHYVSTGFLLGIMTLMDEGLELALGFHISNNLFASLVITADWTVFQTNSILKDISEPSVSSHEIFIPVLIIYPLFLYILSKKYNWNNWREKLSGNLSNN